MPAQDNIICFESKRSAELFASLFPQRRNEILSFDDLWLPQEDERRLPEAERRTLAATLLQTDEAHALPYLLTVEALRQGMVITQEHLDFIFSELPAIPKNEALKTFFIRYLDSSLVFDSAFFAIQWIERFRSQTLELSEPIVFVPSQAPSALFGELAKAYGALVPESRIDSTPVFSPTVARWPRIDLEAQSAVALDRLVTYTQHLLSRKTPEQIGIAFCGSKREELYLRSRLAHAKIPIRNFLPGSATQASGVALYPWTPFAAPVDFVCLEYLGAEWLQPTKTPLLLKESELEALARAGFSLPRWSQTRAERQAWLEPNRAGHHHFVFKGFEDEKVTAKHRLRSKVPTAFSRDENTQVRLRPTAYSASALESFARCPSQYLFSNRLRLRKDEIQNEEAFALLLGQATHLALETHFSKISTKPTIEMLEANFCGALARLVPQLSPEDPHYTVLVETFRKLGAQVPGIEDRLTEFAPVRKVLSNEMAFEIDLHGLAYRGKIDRVEQLGEDSILVLDYKTGNVDFTPDHLAQGIHFQALLYLLAAEKQFPQKCLGVLFYDLKKGELKRGLIRDEGLSKELRKSLTRGHALAPEAFETVRQKGLEALAKVSLEISQGDFAPKPSAKTCDYCDYPSFCRKGLGHG